MDRLGKVVREAREKRGDSLKALARHCKISLPFARHIEHSRSVPVSPRIVECLQHFYRIPRPKLEAAAKSRNRIGRAYYRTYRKKLATTPQKRRASGSARA